jgi:cell division protein FtsI (penicillin-binding protein 3)
MAKPANRIQVLQVGLVLGFLAVVGRAAQVQVGQHERWAAEAESRRTRLDTLPARRGTIHDRHGVPLATAQDFYRVQIATNEVRDTAAVVQAAVRGLGADRRDLQAKFRNGPRQYHFLYGPYTASDVTTVRTLRGVHLTTVYQRSYPSSGLARPIIGSLDPETGLGVSGLERMLDSLLAGRPGEQVSLRDGLGRTYESPQRRLRDPVDGHDVLLTLDAELQSIAESGLDQAIREMEAGGGDVVFLDPRTGELLALASRVAQGVAAASGFTTPFEPGSTAKLFTAAALLTHERVDGDTRVVVGSAPHRIPMPGGRFREVEDAKVRPGEYTLARAIELSSNVAMVQFAERLRPAELYDILRDFGFGSRTGVEFPSESPGELVPPHTWRPWEHGPSIAMGYQISVTPLQLAMAYGAIANGGIMMRPTLVREIRDPEGQVVYRHHPDTVRRVVSAEVAHSLREFLTLAASDSGTGGASQLAGFRVAGKTGTSRVVVGGRYVSSYVSSFAGLFPAEDPQFVVIVKIDNPRGAFYGGETAAPLLRVMLEHALQARQGSLSRQAAAPTAAGASPRSAPTRERGPALVLTLPLPEAVEAAPADVAVPDVAGTTARAAALAMHRRGLQARFRGTGRITGSRPAAGAVVPAGTIVELLVRRP